MLKAFSRKQQIIKIIKFEFSHSTQLNFYFINMLFAIFFYIKYMTSVIQFWKSPVGRPCSGSCIDIFDLVYAISQGSDYL